MPPYADEKELWQEGGDATTESFVGVTFSGESSKATKSVSFHSMVTYREICPLTDIPEEEIRDVWYNDDEYGDIKKRVTDTVHRAGTGEVVEDDSTTMRGLEGRTRFGARRRKNNKKAALTAVWETQIALWRKKADNPNAIAAAYRPHSTHAKYRALQAAHSDALFVQQNVLVSE
eukprot:Nitzschia sp. Nitz4//scaffold289_size23394//12358//12882//NITZ4_008478-RA/size23394-processed-gene-0.6-mRNA-1//1//CDS//3329545825//2400//frame0